MEVFMPLLLRMIYKDLDGNVLKGVGPEELYLPKVHSPLDITFGEVTNVLENELEEYVWSGLDAVEIDWEVISSRIC